MRHYVTTAAWRGPEYPIEANRRRVELTRRITAPSLAAQGTDWTWIVYVQPDDPLLDERLAAFREAGHPVIPVRNNEEAEAAIDWSDPVLTTRIDDDDAFAVDAFRRLHDAVQRPPFLPTALMFPAGYRVRDGFVQSEMHRRNAWVSLYSPQGFRRHVREVQHQRVPAHFPIRVVDDRPAWLRVRHADNDQPNDRRPAGTLTAAVRSLFAVDWDLLAAMAVAA